jgi:uncharacterized damage-inducible protein DinB
MGVSMPRGRPLEVEQELIESFRHCCLVTEYLVGRLPARIWRISPPGGRGRSIAAIVAHMQGVRRTFARLGGAKPGPPALDKQTATAAEARRALHESTQILVHQFEAALESRHARVKGMPRRMVDMITYLMQHDAHHRGQICTLANDLGYKFDEDDLMRFWGWKRIGAAPSRSAPRRRAAG